MTSAVWSSAPATDGGNRAAAKIPHFHDLRENSGALLFEVGKGVRQRAPPILTYHYVRIMPTKKANCRIVPYMSRTRQVHCQICLGRAAVNRLLEHLSAALSWYWTGYLNCNFIRGRTESIMKKKIVIGSLLASGLLLASDQV